MRKEENKLIFKRFGGKLCQINKFDLEFPGVQNKITQEINLKQNGRFPDQPYLSGATFHVE